MNVGQLIDKLRKMPQELEVYDSSWKVIKDVCKVLGDEIYEEIVIII